MHWSQALALLELDDASDPKQVRRAYLKKLKRHKPETDPEGFKQVREAYDVLTAGGKRVRRAQREERHAAQQELVQPVSDQSVDRTPLAPPPPVEPSPVDVDADEPEARPPSEADPVEPFLEQLRPPPSPGSQPSVGSEQLQAWIDQLNQAPPEQTGTLADDAQLHAYLDQMFQPETEPPELSAEEEALFDDLLARLRAENGRRRPQGTLWEALELVVSEPTAAAGLAIEVLDHARHDLTAQVSPRQALLVVLNLLRAGHPAPGWAVFDNLREWIDTSGDEVRLTHGETASLWLLTCELRLAGAHPDLTQRMAAGLLTTPADQHDAIADWARAHPQLAAESVAAMTASEAHNLINLYRPAIDRGAPSVAWRTRTATEKDPPGKAVTFWLFVLLATAVLRALVYAGQITVDTTPDPAPLTIPVFEPEVYAPHPTDFFQKDRPRLEASMARLNLCLAADRSDAPLLEVCDALDACYEALTAEAGADCNRAALHLQSVIARSEAMQEHAKASEIQSTAGALTALYTQQCAAQEPP